MKEEDFKEDLEELQEKLQNLREEIGIEDRRNLIEEKKEFVEEEIQKPRHQIDYDNLIGEIAQVKNLEYFDTNDKAVKQIMQIDNMINRMLDTEGDEQGFHCRKSMCSNTRHRNKFCMYHYAKDVHSDRFFEKYSEPFSYIAVMAMQSDCREHLKGKVRAKTYGAEQCLDQGVTDQTQEFLDQIHDKLSEHDHMKKQWIPMGKIVSLEEDLREEKKLEEFDEEQLERYDAQIQIISRLKQIHQRRLDREESEEYSNEPQFIDIEHIQNKINSLRKTRNDYLRKEEDPEFHRERAKEFHHAVLEIQDLVEEATGLDPKALHDENIKTKQEVLWEVIDKVEEQEKEAMRNVVDEMIEMEKEEGDSV